MNQSRKKRFTYTVFGVYLFFLAWLILFKFYSPPDVLFRSREINLIPFNISEEVRLSVQLKEILYNVFVFVPLGIYLSMAFEKLSFLKKVLFAFLLSFAFEIVQFILGLGISDVTDLITNTLGAVLGMGIYRIFLLLFKEKTDKIVNVIGLIAEACFGVLFLLLTLANL